MHLLSRFKGLQHEFFQVDVDASARRPNWCRPQGRESLQTLGEANKALVLETDMAIMGLYETLGRKLGRPVILSLATAEVLNHATSLWKRTALYFIATAPFRQLVPALSAEELQQIIQTWLKPRPGPA